MCVLSLLTRSVPLPPSLPQGKVATSTRSRSSPVPVSSNDGGAIYEARIEEGKLYYESRAFHKGQHIFIESKEHGQERYYLKLMRCG